MYNPEADIDPDRTDDAHRQVVAALRNVPGEFVTRIGDGTVYFRAHRIRLDRNGDWTIQYVGSQGWDPVGVPDLVPAFHARGLMLRGSDLAEMLSGRESE